MQPAQALSVLSYHNDSPPFIGMNEGSLEHREVPHLELTADNDRPASRASSEGSSSAIGNKPHTLYEPTPVAARIKLPVEQGLSRSHLQFSGATSAFGASVPGSPEEKEFTNSLPNGSYETDAEPSPPRAATPIRLDLDPSSYHFPRHRLNTQMTGETIPQLVAEST
jgi:hypothetical protein